MLANQHESGEVSVWTRKRENFTSRLILTMDTMDVNSLVTYVEEFKVLICRTCRHGLVATGVKKHFQRYHKRIPIEVRNRIVKFVAELDTKKPEEVEAPTVEVAVIKGLTTLHSGRLASSRINMCVSVREARADRASSKPKKSVFQDPRPPYIKSRPGGQGNKPPH